MEKTKNTQKDPDIITTFCNAAYNGMIVAVKNMLPALVMAYVFMLFLNITNLMSVIEFIFKPSWVSLVFQALQQLPSLWVI